ncbi:MULTISPECIES: cupin domain-containing protein [unclassified Kitasatospora]|uniref:cupin domain-containing protein n=1 Tax=unclassified Kitasatospora TaxID=2633591 RepID=UPI0024756BE2|nr:cupin domain-containing protein [Kitasatospora sp. MAP12-44]
MFRFDRSEKVIDRFDSVDATATRVAAGEGPVHLTCLAIEPGGTIGSHPAPVSQLFLVITGEGWVAGPDGRQICVSAGDGVRWEPGEEHASGTTTGLTAIALEGPSLDLFAPDLRGPRHHLP